MSIFTIELNPNFKIFDDKVFYTKEEFINKCKLNGINHNRNDENFIEGESILYSKLPNNLDNYIEIIKSTIYTNNDENILYAEWKIFQVGYEKNKNALRHNHNGLFEQYLKEFNYIAEIRYKDYLIRSLYNYNLKPTQEMYDYLNIFQDNKEIDTNILYEFLIFLTNLYQDFKDIEKYKLM